MKYLAFMLMFGLASFARAHEVKSPDVIEISVYTDSYDEEPASSLVFVEEDFISFDVEHREYENSKGEQIVSHHIVVHFKPDAEDALARFTSNNIGNKIQISFDGVVFSTPKVRGEVSFIKIPYQAE